MKNKAWIIIVCMLFLIGIASLASAETYRTNTHTTPDGNTDYGSETQMLGAKIIAGNTTQIYKVVKYTNSADTRALIYNSGCSLLGSTTNLSSNTFTFSPAVNITKGSIYYVYVDNSGSSRNTWTLNPASFPYVSIDLNFTGGAYGSCSSLTSHLFTISSIITINNDVVADITPPTFTFIPDNVTIKYTQDFWVNYSYADETGLDGLFINDTVRFNYTSLNGVISNKVRLAVGTYIINVTINDTSGNQNYSMFKVIVNKADDICGLALNTTSPVEYGNHFKVATSCTTDYQMFRNGTIIANNSAQVLSVGSYNFSVFRNDTANYTNIKDTVIVTVSDTILPYIAITYPDNNTHSSDYGLNINFTVTDLLLDSCWWSDDGGITNVSSTPCSNLTGAWVAGVNSVTISVNDTSGNVNSTNIRFVIDVTSPSITWYYPNGNYTNSTTLMRVNISLFDTYLDAVNLTVYNSTNGIKYTNNTLNITYTTFNYTDTLDFSSYGGSDIYKIEVCGRDSLTGSPDITPIIDTGSSDTKANITINSIKTERELYLTSNTGTVLDEKTYLLTREDTSDGEHIKSLYKAENVPDGSIFVEYYKIDTSWKILYDRNVPRIVDEKYKTYTRFDDLTSAGYTVKIDYMTDTKTQKPIKNIVVVKFWKEKYDSKTVIDPISGGLNRFCENYTYTLDITPPTFLFIPDNITNYYEDSIAVNYSATETVNWIINSTTYFQINSTGWLVNKSITPAGIYIINVTIDDTLGNQNYSMFKIIVNKASAVITTYINNSPSNLTVHSPVSINLSAILTRATLGNITLWNNFTLINNGTSRLSNVTSFVNLGGYNITSIFEGNANFTANRSTYYLIITDNTKPSITYMSHNRTTENAVATILKFNFTDDYSATANCTLFANETDIDYENNTITLNNLHNATTYEWNLSLWNSNWKWSVSCADESNNRETQTATFTIAVPAGVETGSGIPPSNGGSGITPITIVEGATQNISNITTPAPARNATLPLSIIPFDYNDNVYTNKTMTGKITGKVIELLTTKGNKTVLFIIGLAVLLILTYFVSKAINSNRNKSFYQKYYK